jgi:CubicO group peptidase (beta-lactamase class C family)
LEDVDSVIVFMQDTHETGRSGMKLSHTGALVASFLVSSPVLSPAFAHDRDHDPSRAYGHGHGHGNHDGGELELPATTACFESQVSTGRANGFISGIAATIVLDGRVVYRRGFGTVSPTSTQAVLPTTRFRVGSITKVMTATALLSLSEEHRLPLHAPVTFFLPGLSLQGEPEGEPAWTERLTPHLLMSHQGGLLDHLAIDGPRDDGALRAAFYDPAYTSTIPFTVAPGTFYSYSNPNFMLAGLVAEQAAGLPYREVMRRRVFRPLRMNRTVFLPSEVLADTDFAYGVRPGRVFAPNDYDDAIERPAGFAWSTADDLAKLTLFVLHGNRAALSDRMWRVLESPKVNTHEFLDRVSYAYGLGVQNGVFLPDSSGQVRFYDHVKVIQHDGSIPGYKSFMITLPRQGFGYAAIVNGDAAVPATDLTRCYQVAAVEAVGNRLPAPSPFPDAEIQRDRFGDFVGTFLDRTGIAGRYVLSLTPTGDLWIDLPDVPSTFQYLHVLQPTSRDNFVLVTPFGNIPITGLRAEGSAVRYLRVRPYVLTRVEESATALRSAAAPATVVDVDKFTEALRAAALEDGSSRLWAPALVGGGGAH